MVKCTGRGLVVKRPGVLGKVQMLTLVLGVGVFSLLRERRQGSLPKGSFHCTDLFCVSLAKHRLKSAKHRLKSPKIG